MSPAPLKGTRGSVALSQLAVWLAAGLLGGGASPAAAVPAGEAVSDVRVFPSGSVLNVFMTRGSELSLWQVPAGSPALPGRPAKVWKDFSYLWYGLDAGQYLAVVTLRQVQLYRMGAWDAPVLVRSLRAGTTVRKVSSISVPGSPAFVLALQTGRAAAGAGSDEWEVLESADGRSLQPMKQGTSAHATAITGLTRIGPDELALREAETGAASPAWHLYRWRASEGWQPLAVPGAPGTVTDLKTFDYPDGLALRGAGAPAPWQWYLRTGDEWRQIRDVLGAVRLEDARGFGAGHVLGLLEAPEQDAAQHWRYFYRARQDWQHIQQVLGDHKAVFGVFAVTPFAQERGIAWQRLDEDTGAHAALWSVGQVDDEHHWHGIEPVTQACDARIWDVRAFGGGEGLGVQCAQASAHPLEWRWFVRQDAQWVPLQTRIGGLPEHLWSVVSDNLQAGIAVQSDEQSSPPFTWSWRLPTAGGWKEVSELVSLPAGYPDRRRSAAVSLPETDDSNGRRSVLGVRDTQGNVLWYLRTQTDWLPVGGR